MEGVVHGYIFRSVLQSLHSIRVIPTEADFGSLEKVTTELNREEVDMMSSEGCRKTTNILEEIRGLILEARGSNCIIAVPFCSKIKAHNHVLPSFVLIGVQYLHV